jgi:hypothetical protein
MAEALFNFGTPVHALASRAVGPAEAYVAAAGGGGSAKTGMLNKIVRWDCPLGGELAAS